jgi:hypothetical protein
VSICVCLYESYFQLFKRLDDLCIFDVCMHVHACACMCSLCVNLVSVCVRASSNLLKSTQIFSACSLNVGHL